MMPRLNLSIRTRLTLVMASMTIVILAAGLGLVLSSRIRLLKAEMTRHALMQAQLLGQNCVTALDFGYAADAEEALKKIQADSEVEGACVFDLKGQPFARFGRVGTLEPGPAEALETSAFVPGSLLVRVPITYRDRAFGSLLLQTSTARLEAQVADAKRRFGIFATLMAALSLGLAHLFQRTLTKPILALAAVARQVTEANDYSKRMDRTRGDELGVLFQDFNRMLEHIHDQDTALRESEARTRRLIETTSQGCWQLDPEGRTVDCNQAMLDMLGVSREDALGRFPMVFLDENSREMAKDIIAHRWETENRTFDLVLRRPDGTRVPIHCNATNLRGEDGTFQGSFAMVSDLTERIRAEEMRLARDAAEAAALSKSEFLANMSHEIRTPMNAVLGFVGLALRQELTPKVRDYLEKVHTSGQSLLGIINDILDFSKIEAGKLELETTPFRLSDVLKHVGDLFSHRAAEAGLDFSVSMGAAVPDGLIGDPLRLGQVLINLTGNALKFTQQGHVQVRVEYLREGEAEARLWFYVQDTGIGMTEAQQGRLFQAFSQADSSTSRHFGGTGLGLSIAQRLVEKMDGEIRVLSQPGKGSTFAFSARFDLDPNFAPRPLRSQELLRGKRVLVVDDSPVVREVLMEQLWSLDMQARAVESGEEALEAFRTDAFDLVLMDWRLPGLDGLETSRRIRAQVAPLPAPAIIMVTAYGREDVSQQAATAGIAGFLVKPITPTLLTLTLLDALPGEPGQTSFAAQQSALATRGRSFLGLRVLVVDDNAINLEVAKDLLLTEGLVVEVAQSGPEAIQLVTQKAFHVVFMDIQMPGMDGYDTTRVIRQMPTRLDLPIIAMTAHALPRYRDLCLEAGMNDFITKPIDPDRLFEALGKWVQPLTGNPEPLTPARTVEVPPEDAQEILDPSGAFDASAGVRRLGGNRALFLRLMGTFAVDFARTGQATREALEAGDSGQAEHLVHTVKGVAANLSALPLAQAAGAVEKALQAADPAEALALLPAFEAALRDALKAASDLVAAQPAAPAVEKPAPALPVDDLVQALSAELEQGNPHAEATWQALATALPEAASLESLQSVAACIDNYDFPGAAKALAAWRAGREALP